MKCEYRLIQSSALDVRNAAKGNTAISGLAVPYDQWTRVWSKSGEVFLERIARGAITESLKSGTEVSILVEHDRDKKIGSTRNSLRLIDRPDGLYFEFEADASTELVRKVINDVRSGFVDRCSFEFRAVKEKVEELAGVTCRTVLELELFEVSLVSLPAYQGTKASVDDNIRPSHIRGASMIETARAIRWLETANFRR